MEFISLKTNSKENDLLTPQKSRRGYPSACHTFSKLLQREATATARVKDVDRAFWKYK